MHQLRHYAGLIRRWLWLILLGIAICSSVTFGISKYIIRPVYQATALVQVNGSLTSSSNDVFSDQALAVSDSLLITSATNLQEVAKRVPGVSLSQLELVVSASPRANTQVIEVRAQANNPQLAADIVNTVVRVFIQQQVGKMTASLKSQDTQISHDLLTTKTAINQAQAQLTALQQSGAPADKIAHQNDIINTYQTNYNSLLTNYRQVQLQENQAGNALSVAQIAIPPDQPSSPHVLLNTIIAALMGLLLMIVLALLLDWLDTSIQTSEDVAKLAQLEPLGSVPFSEHPILLANPADPSVASDDAVEEAFMVISTSFSTLSKGQSAVLVTGLRSGAGITTTAINLAMALAQSGKRVLLVDANVRRSSLHEIFHCPNTRGLVNSLADVYQFREEVIHSWLNLWRTNIPNLWLLPIGSVTSHVQLKWHVQELRMLKNWLLPKPQLIPGRMPIGAVDIIIFDAPALNEGVDAMALASVTDCSVIVVQAGKEQNEMVSKVRTTLQRLGSPVLGVVVNRQTTKHRSYFYTDHQRQNSVSIGSSSLQDATPSSFTRQTLLRNTPPSLLTVNYADGLTGQPQPPLDGDTHNLGETLSQPSTLSSLEQLRLNQFKRIMVPDHRSN